MLRRSSVALTLAVCGATATASLCGGRAAGFDVDPSIMVADNGTGQMRSFSTQGVFDLDNPFFQDLGTNGRRCVTCHQPTDGWTITPAGVQRRFERTDGDDPIFRNNDGSNCEGADPATRDDRERAYSLLLERGLIRIGLDVPPGAEFAIDSVADPYVCGPATNDVSFYRRPPPAANVSFLSAVMWDGRESQPGSTIRQDLRHQANSATRGHAASARDLTADEANAVVDFVMNLFAAQARDTAAGNFQAQGARGGPHALSRQPFFVGINDPVGLNPTGAAFDPHAFTLFDAWATLPSVQDDAITEARRAVARGQALFNARTFTISGVAGLNGETFASGLTVPQSVTGTCTVCHDAPNVGNHSVKAPLDIGLADPAVARYLPVYTVRHLVTGETTDTTDLGRAMITGKWRDIGKFKGPVLRALAARAPYFHNGSAATLEEAVQFYDTRFGLGLTARERLDLVAFLRAL
jgi:cytochrome c peroxidase